MSPYFLAVDIGASSGRHMLGHLEKGRLVLEEIYRFENGMKQTKEGLCWDIPALFQEIKTGIRRCGERGKIPVSMGIDTWAVDYVLLDEQDQILGDTFGYRDSRTEGMDEEVYLQRNFPILKLHLIHLHKNPERIKNQKILFGFFASSLYIMF